MPRQGPRRPILAARVDPEEFDWVHNQASAEGISYPEFIRRIVRFARLNMPDHYRPPKE